MINIQRLSDSTNALADLITELHFEQNPALLERYGVQGKIRCHEDAIFHLHYLAEALTMGLPDMYANYILWVSSMLKSRHIPDSDLQNNLGYVQVAIHNLLGHEFASVASEYIDFAKVKLLENREQNASYIFDDNPLKAEVNVYLEHLLQGKRQDATQLISELIDKGVSIKDIYNHIFQTSQYEIGRLWQGNKITVAHEHYCTAATQQIMSGLYPYIFSTKRKGKTLVACSISGELHELGIRMVADFFEMDGWDTYYLGANMPHNQLQQALLTYNTDVLALSVTLPIHVSKSVQLIKEIRMNGAFDRIKIMVGGNPFLTNKNLWRLVAADASADNANEAIIKANELVK